MAYCVNCGETDNFMFAKKRGVIVGFCCDCGGEITEIKEGE